ncbi:MAG: hypothetical protein FJ276_26150 [Planctomycetes bacterium]|nr:hypothetical protein [Planctomycetota bacterium]
MAEEHYYSKAVCDEKHGNLDQRMKHIEHAVFGNGKPSLSTQIAELVAVQRTGMWALGVGLTMLQVATVIILKLL